MLNSPYVSCLMAFHKKLLTYIDMHTIHTIIHPPGLRSLIGQSLTPNSYPRPTWETPSVLIKGAVPDPREPYPSHSRRIGCQGAQNTRDLWHRPLPTTLYYGYYGSRTIWVNHNVGHMYLPSSLCIMLVPTSICRICRLQHVSGSSSGLLPDYVRMLPSPV